MKKHILVTVSERLNTQYGVQFVNHFFSKKTDLGLTLFYTAPKAAVLLEGERDHEAVRRSDLQSRQYQEKGRKALESSKKTLMQAGFPAENINIRLQALESSRVMDIIKEGRSGRYDAVVLGRRGLTLLESLMDDSVSKTILEQEVPFPLWLCRSPEANREGILLYMDGSDAAARMADHVGFILAAEKRHSVTLLVLGKKGSDMEKKAENIFGLGQEVLLKHGLPPDLIKTKFMADSDVSGAIKKEADQGQFAVVALGRRSKYQGLLGRIFKGSVCGDLFTGLSGAALWISH